MKTGRAPHKCWLLIFPKLDHPVFAINLTLRFPSVKSIPLGSALLSRSQTPSANFILPTQCVCLCQPRIWTVTSRSFRITLLPPWYLPSELWMHTYCPKLSTPTLLYQKIALASLHLVCYRCYLLHACGYLQYIQLSKYLSSTYITNMKKRDNKEFWTSRSNAGKLGNCSMISIRRGIINLVVDTLKTVR